MNKPPSKPWRVYSYVQILQDNQSRNTSMLDSYVQMLHILCSWSFIFSPEARFSALPTSNNLHQHGKRAAIARCCWYECYYLALDDRDTARYLVIDCQVLPTARAKHPQGVLQDASYFSRWMPVLTQLLRARFVGQART